jgi:hypothetical protein
MIISIDSVEDNTEHLDVTASKGIATLIVMDGMGDGEQIEVNLDQLIDALNFIRDRGQS